MKTSNKYLVAIAASFLFVGILEPQMNSQQQQDSAITHIILLSILIFCWCKAHIKDHNVSAPKSSALLCGLISIIGVPLYFYRVYGFKNGSLKTIKAILFLFLVSFISVLASLLVKSM